MQRFVCRGPGFSRLVMDSALPELSISATNRLLPWPPVLERIQESRVMKNFLRAMRFAWPYRYRTIISVLCALLAAVFWGLNFTAIYPVLKIIGSGQTLQEWVDTSILKVEEQINPLQNHVDD